MWWAIVSILYNSYVMGYCSLQGSFVVNMGMIQAGKDVKWTNLATIKDTNTTSLYVYESTVDIPK